MGIEQKTISHRATLTRFGIGFDVEGWLEQVNVLGQPYRSAMRSEQGIRRVHFAQEADAQPRQQLQSCCRWLASWLLLRSRQRRQRG